jgi:hypothetical protein
VLNIYLFQDERFPFADGRLLLRGANATGKSRVLAFLLPFLLDGKLHPTRLEPDRDATRQVAWNLLMGEHRDRLGYTWLELGRQDAQQGPQYLTLGCGLRAVKDRGIVEHWFFLTPQRIDRDLHLVSDQQTALTKRQLNEALGDAGQLIERVSEYQRAVDDALFRMGDRYHSLIDLLLQLRQPQLARKLEGRLPVIYAAGHLSEVARRWKCQFNENSKGWAVWEVLPELNHNAVVGYEFPAAMSSMARVVMLLSDLYSPRLRLRMEVTGEILSDKGILQETIVVQGSSPLAQVMWSIHLGDYVSYYLAALRGVDPSPVKTIAYLKERLAQVS